MQRTLQAVTQSATLRTTTSALFERLFASVIYAFRIFISFAICMRSFHFLNNIHTHTHTYIVQCVCVCNRSKFSTMQANKMNIKRNYEAECKMHCRKSAEAAAAAAVGRRCRRCCQRCQAKAKRDTRIPAGPRQQQQLQQQPQPQHNECTWPLASSSPIPVQSKLEELQLEEVLNLFESCNSCCQRRGRGRVRGGQRGSAGARTFDICKFISAAKLENYD